MMIDSSNAYDEWMANHNNDWSESEHYLNHPGLLYMFYGKVKPMFGAGLDASIIEIINRQDDENFIITCDGPQDPYINEVYIEFFENNTILLTDSEVMGYIDNTGQLSFYVKPVSHIVGGYIDNSTGLIPVIDSSTGTVFDEVQGDASGKINIMIELS